MIVHILVSSLSQDEKDLVGRMMNVIGPKNWDITNILNYEVPNNTSGKDIYLCFGKRAVRSIVKDYEILEFPEIRNLLPLPENNDTRQEVFAKLKALQTHLAEVELIQHKELPKLSSNDLIQIYKKSTADKPGITLICNNGKSLRVSFTDEDKVKENINITFQELLAIKLGMEIFNG